MWYYIAHYMPDYMHELILTPIPSSRKEDKQRKKLHELITKKRTLLEKLVIQSEMLRVELELVKQEYMVKVGSLFLKDNQLDLEIIHLKNILQLMKQGKTHEEAVMELSQTYYAQQLDMEEEQERIEQQEYAYHQRMNRGKKQVTGTLRTLWKKLIARFHPDLVQDPDEKRRREDIMKQVNQAYDDADYDRLMKIDQQNIDTEESTIFDLENLLVTIDEELHRQKLFYQSLRASEWFGWKVKIEKMKNKKNNPFSELEKKLLKDIVEKFAIIKRIKTQIEMLDYRK